MDASPSIFCHFFTRVDSLLKAGLLSDADVLAPGVPAFETMNPYLSVTGLTGVLATASEVASATEQEDRCNVPQAWIQGVKLCKSCTLLQQGLEQPLYHKRGLPQPCSRKLGSMLCMLFVMAD